MRSPKSKKTNLKDLKVLIVDDHSIYRKGMLTLLNIYPFITKCDEAENGLVAIELLKRCNYDIVFLDIDMPLMDGVELARIMKRDFKDSKIIVMTALDKKAYVYEFLEIGVAAYLLKGYLTEEIIVAFEHVLDGGTYITKEITEMYHEYLLEKSRVTHKNFNEPELSKMEKKIIVMMCEQLTSEQIANRLGVRRTTVNTIRKRIFKKLKVVNSIGVAIYAVRTRLTKLHDLQVAE